MNHNLGFQTNQQAMGTVMIHKAFGVHGEDALLKVHNEIGRLESLLSRFIPGSEISSINESAGEKSVLVCQDTYEVLSKAVQFSAEYSNYFDLTIEPLVTLWNLYQDSHCFPNDFDIKMTLPLVNYRDLNLDAKNMTAELKNQGQAIDLGGIGKGFAADRILDIYREYEIDSAFSNLGGNVVTFGSKPDGSPWKIGLQDPREENHLIGSVGVINKAVVTSGDYHRYYTDYIGNRRHHILNPRTGYPAESGLASVTIIHDNSLTADALSTIIFVAGKEQGLEILKLNPQAEAILIDTLKNVFISRSLEGCFEAEKGIVPQFLK